MSWERLSSQIALSEGFWLGFIFGADLRGVRELEAQAATALKAEGKDVDARYLPEPDDDPNATLRWLLTEHPPTTGFVWLVATGGLNVPRAWLVWWERLLAPLNERRETLRQAVPCSLVLAGPSDLLPVARDIAPDLWSYRSMLLDLPHRWLPAPRLADFDDSDQSRLTMAYRESPDSLLRRWEDLDRHGAAQAERGERENSLATYKEALALALHMKADSESPKTLGNAARSMRNVGRAYRELGNLEAALGAYVSALEVTRHVIARYGEIPEMMQTLADLLEAAAEVQEAQGDLDAAQARRYEAAKVALRMSSSRMLPPRTGI